MPRESPDLYSYSGSIFFYTGKRILNELEEEYADPIADFKLLISLESCQNLVRNCVEETLNSLLDAETVRLVNAERISRSLTS